jgi:hypothetical protein
MTDIREKARALVEKLISPEHDFGENPGLKVTAWHLCDLVIKALREVERETIKRDAEWMIHMNCKGYKPVFSDRMFQGHIVQPEIGCTCGLSDRLEEK